METLQLIGVLVSVGLFIVAMVSVLIAFFSLSANGTNRRLTKLEKRIDKLENGQVQLNKRIDRLENGQVQLNKRIDRLEGRLDTVESKIDELIDIVKNLQVK